MLLTDDLKINEQVTSNVLMLDIFYFLCALLVFVGVVGLALIDAGLCSKKNVLNTWVQKMLAGFVSALSFSIVGFGVWYWQFNTAFGVPDPLVEGIKTWWLGGSGFTHFAQEIDPKVIPGADNLQVFGVFFFLYAFFLGALIHTAGNERLRARALYPLCFVVVGIAWPFLLYLTFGSLSPMTNSGLHDFLGLFPLYIPVAVFSVMLSMRLGPRKGAFDETPNASLAPASLTSVAIGVSLLLAVIPAFFLGSSFIEPGLGFFGISGTTSGFGIVFANVFMAFAGGTIVGAIMSYRTHNVIWILGGPIMGSISVGALADVAKPWQCLLVGAVAPLTGYVANRMLHRLRIDDTKLGTLILGPSIYGALVSGIIIAGTPTGGFFGLEGEYALQHATISFGMQLLGVLVSVAAGAIVGGAMWLIPLRVLRISDEAEEQGLDLSTWGVGAHDVTPDRDRVVIGAS